MFDWGRDSQVQSYTDGALIAWQACWPQGWHVVVVKPGNKILFPIHDWEHFSTTHRLKM